MVTTRNKTDLGARFRRAREQAGLTVGQAQRRAGVGRIDGIEAGRIPTEAEARALAQIYGVSLAWLRDGVPTPIPEETVQILRDADMLPADRDSVLELLASLPSEPPDQGVAGIIAGLTNAGLTNVPAPEFEIVVDPDLPLERTKAGGGTEPVLCWLIDGKVCVHPERRALFDLWILDEANAAEVRRGLPRSKLPSFPLPPSLRFESGGGA